MCDRKIRVELKENVFKIIIRPAMTYGSECWAVKKNDERKLNTPEMRMLIWTIVKTRNRQLLQPGSFRCTMSEGGFIPLICINN